MERVSIHMPAPGSTRTARSGGPNRPREGEARAVPVSVANRPRVRSEPLPRAQRAVAARTASRCRGRSEPSPRARKRELSRQVVALYFALSLLPGCGIYSFTGASIPSHLRTIAIPLAEDASVNTLTALDEQFTEMLLQRFVRQTRLVLEPQSDDANVVLTTRIERYANTPTSVGGGERATLNRVTLSVRAIYHDQVNGSDVFDRSFTAFEEYDPLDPESGLAGEQVAADAVLRKIADDIFTAATSNW